MTTDRLLAHKMSQWKHMNPDAMIVWIRDHCEVQVEPYGHLIIWKVDE